MSTVDLPYPPPLAGIEYHLLSPADKIVLDRAAVWVHFPVAFCREAMNFHPHWYQDELIRDDSIFIACSWSRQIGKSEAIAHKAIHVAYTSRNADVLIIAPGRRQAQELYRKIVQAIKSSPLISASVLGKPTQEQTTFRNGCRIINLPAGDEGVTVRGYSIILLILEEAAYIPDDVIIAIEQGLSSTGGSEIMISTPRGRSNTFYRVFNPTPELRYDMTKQGRQQVGNWACYRYPHTVAYDVFKPDGTPQLSATHVEIQKGKLPDWRFKTEYEALFIEDIDSYWSQKLIDGLYNPQFKIVTQPEPNATYFMGIDIAKGGDFTSVSIGERLDFNPLNGKPLDLPHLQIVNRHYWKIGSFQKQYPLFIGAIKLWNPRVVYFDKTSMGEAPFEELQKTYELPVEGVNFSNVEKIAMYGNMTLLMASPAEIEGWNARVQSYYDIEAKRQYEMMIYEIPTVLSKQTGIKHPGTGYYIYAAKGHDDIPSSDVLLARCISGLDVGDTNIALVQKNAIKEAKKLDDSVKRIEDSFMVAVQARKKSMKKYRSDKVFWD